MIGDIGGQQRAVQRASFDVFDIGECAVVVIGHLTVVLYLVQDLTLLSEGSLDRGTDGQICREGRIDLIK